jgi:hypothetical protein
MGSSGDIIQQPKNVMKKYLLTTLLAVGLTTALATKAADEKTITGEGTCGKCGLKETKSCQNVVQVKEGGKTVNYYLADNQVAKDFHKNVCKTTANVKATGTVKEVDGKKEFTASKIEVVK